jgi:3-(3-hydroxy-phenyl)propionate hydroxylase
VVQKRFALRARFLVGTDGHNSLVRRRLGLEYTQVAGPEFFAAYEFESAAPIDHEVRVVLDPGTTNVLWPLPGNKGRWTFQLINSEISTEFPEKEQRAVRFEQQKADEMIRAYVQKISHRRAPWFTAPVNDVTWCTDVVFEQRLARQFGRGRCWLAGDSAHQTGPVGAQSMNVGMSEGHALAGVLRRILKDNASIELLQSYNQDWQNEWRRLLGLNGGTKTAERADAWVRERRARLLSCLPASGKDLVALGNQLGLEV